MIDYPGCDLGWTPVVPSLLTSSVALCATFVLCSCGTVVPSFDPKFVTEYDASTFVNSIANHVHCELAHAVKDTYRDLGAPVSWLAGWSAKVSLTLTVDEKTSLNPGLSLTKILSDGTINLALGGTFTTDATRVLTLSWFLVFRDLLREKPDTHDCALLGPYPIYGNLKIKEGLYSGAFSASTMGTVSDPFKSGGPLDVIEHHVTFEVDFIGNATPSFKFVNVSANTDGTFLTASRTRKDDLLITKQFQSKNYRVALSTEDVDSEYKEV